MSELNYLYGKPLSKADFKTFAEDFMVDEDLGIEFTGSGEHVCLQVVKKGENTQFIAKRIAEKAGVSPRDVSYAGLKDRHGVCTQWFSVPVPIKKHINTTTLADHRECPTCHLGAGHGVLASNTTRWNP